MAITTLQQRMSALNPACPWRGVLVNAALTGFPAAERASADYMYSRAASFPGSGGDGGGGGTGNAEWIIRHRRKGRR